ncbi:MAG: DUF222 domain-containing protein, partial [Acidimicrobiales bacterium]
PVRWVAQQGGTTGSDARGSLELARTLGTHPLTKAALLEGAVSLSQAKEIARAHDEAPGQEHELVEAARAGDLSSLRDEVRSRRLAAMDPGDLHLRQVGARRFRHWRDGLGMVCVEGALPPETGLPLVTRLEREAARLHRQAKHAGIAEGFCAHAADALVGLFQRAGAGSGAKARTDLVVVCDLYAWRRGHGHQGEPCHLIGGGPIPVEVAKELSNDAFLKVVLHDGVDIHLVCHVGRRYTAELRTAMDLGPVPAFSGRACVDCERTWGLQHDHTDPIAHTGRTTYENMRDRCYPCHVAKTERDRQEGLLGARAKARGPGPPVKSKAKSPRPPREPGRGAGTAVEPGVAIDPGGPSRAPVRRAPPDGPP